MSTCRQDAGFQNFESEGLVLLDAKGIRSRVVNEVAVNASLDPKGNKARKEKHAASQEGEKEGSEGNEPESLYADCLFPYHRYLLIPNRVPAMQSMLVSAHQYRRTC